ncbi:MAG TPA: YebF family protein [Arsenophonus sp.]
MSAKVKNDFIQTRLPFTILGRKKKLLGPKVVVWINNSITPIKDSYKIPLIVCGARKDINYQVIVDCQN